MFNKVILVGQMIMPPTTKTVGSYEIGTLTLKVDREYIKQGVPQLESNNIECTLFGKLIEIASKFDLGQMILVEGRLRVGKSKNKSTGAEYNWLSVTAERISAVGDVEVDEAILKSVVGGVEVPEELPF